MVGIDRITLIWSGAVVGWAGVSDDGSPASFIHRSLSREIWRESSALQRALLVFAFLARPVTIPATAGFFTFHNGRAIQERTGKSIARQLQEQITVAVRHSIPPPWYYILELYDDDKRRRASEYLNRFETKAFVYGFLRRARQNGRQPTAEFLSNKAAFSVRCAEHGVAAVPALFVVQDGQIVGANGHAPALPKIDLFVKPLRGAGGRGAERWDYQPSGNYRDPSGTLRSEAQLVEHLLSLSRSQSYVVRPRVVNHPAIADLSNGALTTVRVMTCVNEQGAIEPCASVFRMAQGENTVVDNFHAGGIVAKVDVRTGELGRGVDGGTLGGGKGWHDVHPDTGARIQGRKLPMWNNVLDLVTRAHGHAFADQAVVGWDVALLHDGPSLVEGNKGPCVDLLQRPHGEPLGNARLGELLAFHLRRALEKQPR